MKAFNIIHYPRVPKWIVGLHISFANWLAEQYQVQHTIRVHLAPSISMPTHDGRRCWGYFTPRKRPEIVLACGRPKIKGRLPDRCKQVWFLLNNFAHEFCHYEQWRDGKPQSHRGVDRRATAMLRRFDRDYFKELAA